jgi:NADP-dependent 3-hydroxy acid dehydrogenase YdfG
MESKVVLITAASAAMGQLYTQKMLKQGWQETALEVNHAGLDALPNSATLLCMNEDITDEEAVIPSVRKMYIELDPVHCVVNAAVIMPTSRILDQEIDLTEIKYGGLVSFAHVNLQDMPERKRGEFISIESLARHLSTSYISAYNASKFAVIADIEVLYQKNKGKDVNFTCICPPPVQTPLLKQTRKTVYPKIFGVFRTLSSETVITKIGRALTNSKFWISLGSATKFSWLFRRFYQA